MNFMQYKKKAQKELQKLADNITSGRVQIYENYGQKEYRKFKDRINADNNLNYSEKAELCAYYTEKASRIDQGGVEL